MDVESEIGKIDALEQLLEIIKDNKAFDIEDHEIIEQYIDEKKRKIEQNRKKYNEAKYIKDLILQRETLLSEFETQNECLKNTPLLCFFKEKQRKLMDSLKCLNE